MNARVMKANAVVIRAMKHPQNIKREGFCEDSFMSGTGGGREVDKCVDDAGGDKPESGVGNSASRWR